MDFEKLIEPYLGSLTGKNDDTLAREGRTIRKFIKFLDERGIKSPSDTDIDTYTQVLQGQGINAATSRRHLNKIKNFLDWVNDRSTNPTGGVTMEEELTTTAVNETVEAQKVKKSTGRPKRTDGKENRSHKFSIYLTPTVFTALDELSRFNGYSITELLTRLAQEYISTHQHELDLFREAREKALNK